MKLIIALMLSISASAYANPCVVYMNKRFINDQSAMNGIIRSFYAKGYEVTLYKDMTFRAGELHVMLGGLDESGGVFSKKCAFEVSVIKMNEEGMGEPFYSKRVELGGRLKKCFKAMESAILVDENVPACNQE